MIDLHIHSTASDGSKSPAEIIGLGAEWADRYSAPVTMALTDHDTVSGIPEFLDEASKYPSRVHAIGGVEFSTYFQKENGIRQTIHMLGYGIDFTNEELRERLEEFRHSRDIRNMRILERLNTMGMKIFPRDIEPLTSDSSVGRPAIAMHMIKMGYVSSVEEAFQRYLNRGRPCYVERIRPTLEEVIRLIHSSGGIAVLAHPVLYTKLDKGELEELIRNLHNSGLDGLEVYYSRNKQKDTDRFRSLAEKYNLRITGGSDYHGFSKPDIGLFRGTGNLNVPPSVLEGFPGL